MEPRGNHIRQMIGLKVRDRILWSGSDGLQPSVSSCESTLWSVSTRQGRQGNPALTSRGQQDSRKRTGSESCSPSSNDRISPLMVISAGFWDQRIRSWRRSKRIVCRVAKVPRPSLTFWESLKYIHTSWFNRRVSWRDASGLAFADIESAEDTAPRGWLQGEASREESPSAGRRVTKRLRAAKLCLGGPGSLAVHPAEEAKK